MDLKAVLQIIEAAEKANFDKFEITEKDFSIKMERTKPDQIVMAAPQMPAMAQVAMQEVAPMAAPVAQAAPTAAPAEQAAPATGANIPNAKDVASPLVGIFHEVSGGKAVKIGDKLKKGDVLCMIEAMKLMNEIVMPEDGEIVWVAAAENDTVEYEQLLYSYVK